jgi:hypothetical protein
MKTSIRPILAAFFIPAIIGIYSCQEKDPKDNALGTAEFSVGLKNAGNNAKSAVSADSTDASYNLIVSVTDLNGSPVLTDEKIPLYAFGPDFVSDKIELKEGDYLLTKFMVMNTSGNVLYASPRAGSSLDYLVTNPLPLQFTIYADQVSKIVPEVLAVEDYTPGDFGYANFGAQIISQLSFYTVCALDNPLIMAPTMFTSARLTVYSNDGWAHTFYLDPTLNHLIIRGGSDFYTFVLEKEGYSSQTMQYSATELIGHIKENPLVLYIQWGNPYKELVLQPGPKEGMDAMISNLEPDKNFGGYPYFEATFLPEQVLTVMRSNRSLIWFDQSQLPESVYIKKATLQLHFDIPIPWDSTIMTMAGPTGFIACSGVLQQVTTPWEESSVTWNNQPKSTELNQVFIYPFIQNSNFIEVDVTNLMSRPNDYSYPNYGMIFKLFPEGSGSGFRFTSSDYPDSTMWPKLTIQYTTVK